MEVVYQHFGWQGFAIQIHPKPFSAARSIVSKDEVQPFFGRDRVQRKQFDAVVREDLIEGPGHAAIRAKLGQVAAVAIEIAAGAAHNEAFEAVLLEFKPDAQ